MNRIEISQMDALEWLATLPDESAHVIITDPPYWTLDKWRAMGTTTRLGGNRVKENRREEMFYETIDRDYLWDLFLELDRVLTLDGHLYIFGDDIVAPILLHWVREAQDEHRFGEAHMLVWDKVNQGMGYHYRRRYECIVFAWREKREGVKPKFKRRLADLGIPDVLAHKRIVNSYPTEKPLGLIATLVKQSLRSGECIVDPFAGSGVVGMAASVLCPNATIKLNDIADGSIKFMKERLGPGRVLETCPGETQTCQTQPGDISCTQ